MSVEVIHGDMREVLGKMVAEGKVVQAVCTDPPYHLTAQGKGGQSNLVRDPNTLPPSAGTRYTRVATGFMGKQWDGGDIAFQPGTWRLCFELLPPGGHLLAFAGTRTYHRMAVAIEEAGFEIRDTLAWLYGSGFPKSLNVSKAIDKAAGVEREVIGDSPFADRKPNGSAGIHSVGLNDTPGSTITAPATDAARQWDGWGTALKPAMELICLARKPLDGTVAANVLAHGTGALNIDACRVGTEGGAPAPHNGGASNGILGDGLNGGWGKPVPGLGRWPANVVTDGSDEVVSAFPDAGAANNGRADRERGLRPSGFGNVGADKGSPLPNGAMYGDSGSAARFFYSARPDDEKRFWYGSKADADDRLQSRHPTIKPVDLMRWLVRLITPPGGTCLDPFAGSGTTGMACMAEGIDCLLIEREAEYVADIKARIAHVHGDDTPLFAAAPVVPPQGELL